MKARLVGNSANELVHGHSLKKGCAKFEIVNVYVRAAMKSDWGYDADIHLPGGFIAWPLRNARVVKTVKKATDTEHEGTIQEKVEDEKQMLPPCNCRAACYSKITDDERVQIHRKYWDSSYKEKRTWILQSIAVEGIKRRRADESSSRRSKSRKYNLNGEVVCKVMFMSTLGYIHDKFITVALNSNFAEDRRGSHSHEYHSTQDVDKAFMEDHINSFEPGISHYRRCHAPNRQYLDPSLSIAELYRSYEKKCKDEQRKCCSKSTYTRVLHEMNISFAKLGHEECEVCLKHALHECEGDKVERDGCKKTTEEECECCKEFTRLLGMLMILKFYLYGKYIKSVKMVSNKFKMFLFT